eukprot:scaffold25344_cov333-Cylindrotheca_fusiformis.AAC.1
METSTFDHSKWTCRLDHEHEHQMLVSGIPSIANMFPILSPMRKSGSTFDFTASYISCRNLLGSILFSTWFANFPSMRTRPVQRDTVLSRSGGGPLAGEAWLEPPWSKEDRGSSGVVVS